MRAVDMIIKKREKQEMTREEIDFFVKGFTSGEIPDYQVSAWAMAVLLNGMNPRETTDLTMAMAHSGDILDLSQSNYIVVDKHSTGGVGDKTTLVVAPLVAACGQPVGKMSGRGLGFSGGTIDKLESIPGFRINLSMNEFMTQLEKIGIVLTGQSADLAPADGKLYALRDVTGTVQSIPLIASSIMSKKIAAGAQAMVLDVKCGVGAFMENLDDARELGLLMVDIARLAGRKAVALLSDMNQPLGYAVGNALELMEAIDVLQGKGPADFRAHCLEVAAQMLVLARKSDSVEAARNLAQTTLDDGLAWDKFRQLVFAQGGEVACVDNPARLPHATYTKTFYAEHSAFVSGIHARLIGEATIRLGAGRLKKNDPIDYAVGMEVFPKVGDFIEAGKPLFTIHANQESHIQEEQQNVLDAFSWSAEAVQPLPLFYDILS